MGARGSLGGGQLDSVELDLRISKAWRAGHDDNNMSDGQTFGPPQNDHPPAWVAMNPALTNNASASEERLLSPHWIPRLFKKLNCYVLCKGFLLLRRSE